MIGQSQIMLLGEIWVSDKFQVSYIREMAPTDNYNTDSFTVMLRWKNRNDHTIQIDVVGEWDLT